MDIQLNFINQSQDINNTQIVIFQNNEATDFNELAVAGKVGAPRKKGVADFDGTAVAWLVIQNVGVGDKHRFTFPLQMNVGASDSTGNLTPQQPAQHGQLFAMAPAPSGSRLTHTGSATSKDQVQVLNALHKGAIDAHIYRDGKLLATKTAIAPQQKAAFQFNPTIWIGAVSQVVQGQVMNSAILSTINTELSLLGVKSADIVMTGGGPGPNSTPFQFTLSNVVRA